MNLFNFRKKIIFQRFWLGIFVLIVSFLIYLKTLAPTVLWGDGANLAISAFTLDLDYIPDTHPLHSLIGSLFNLIPFGDIAYRQNLMSAFFGSLTVFLLYLVILKITNSRLSSICVALSLAVSHTFWHLSVINESYSLLAFFFVLLILILLFWQENHDRRLLYLFFFLLGLSISNHGLMVFFIPAYILYFLCFRRDKEILIKRNIFLIFISFLLGSSLLIYLVIYKEHNLAQALSCIVRPFKRFYGPIYKMVSESIKYPIYLFYQFPLLGFLLGLKGIRKFFKLDKRLFSLLLIISIINICFASGYMRQKQFYFLIPSYLIFAIFIGIGFNSIKNNFRKVTIFLAMVCLPILLYYNMPFIVDSLSIDLVKARSLPYRDNNRYFLLPDKSNYFGAYRYGEEVLKILEPGSIIIADFTILAVLDYFCIVENKDCSAKIIFNESIDTPQFIADNIENHKIYLADLEPYYDVDNLKQKYNIIPKGAIFQVIKKDN